MFWICGWGICCGCGYFVACDLSCRLFALRGFDGLGGFCFEFRWPWFGRFVALGGSGVVLVLCLVWRLVRGLVVWRLRDVLLLYGCVLVWAMIGGWLVTLWFDLVVLQGDAGGLVGLTDLICS